MRIFRQKKTKKDLDKAIDKLDQKILDNKTKIDKNVSKDK